MYDWLILSDEIYNVFFFFGERLNSQTLQLLYLYPSQSISFPCKTHNKEKDDLETHFKCLAVILFEPRLQIADGRVVQEHAATHLDVEIRSEFLGNHQTHQTVDTKRCKADIVLEI